MVALNAVGAELEDRLDQFQKELDALRADARAQEATWQGLDRRHVGIKMRGDEKPGPIFYTIFNIFINESLKTCHRITKELEVSSRATFILVQRSLLVYVWERSCPERTHGFRNAWGFPALCCLNSHPAPL